MKSIQFLSLFIFLLAPIRYFYAQTGVEGYVFEENNRGYLRQVKLVVLELPGNILRAELESDGEGHFATSLPGGEYRIVASKDIFHELEQKFSVGEEKVFLKLEMQRRPGYLFDVTIAEAGEDPELVVDAVQGAWIEIYNRTQDRSELVLRDHPESFFQHTFEQGNHYTILIRKPGFLAKRIEVYVNVKGCILCVDGARSLTPGVTENLTAGNKMGTLLTNIELERAKLDKRIQIQNIYYDFDKWDIRPDAAERLDLVVQLMNDNPGLSVELGSHTDSRGNDDYNMALSHKRAASAVAYIVSEGVDSLRITSKGYGESQLVNRCRNDVPCSEEEHQQNRRTELRITGISGDTLEHLRWPSLEQIVRDEEVSKAKKQGKAIRERQLPEANNSVPLPAKSEEELPDVQIQPEKLQMTPAPAAAAPPPAIRQSGEVQPAPKQADPLKELAKNYNGFTVEIAQADSLLSAGDIALQGFSEILWQKDQDGRYYFFTGQFSTPAKVRNFFRQTVKPNNAKARMVRFVSGRKKYVE